jgi:hypothetical protein
MNEQMMRNNYQKLLEYHQDYELNPNTEPSRITIELTPEWADLLVRIVLLEGTSKTAVVRKALDGLADEIGSSVLYPAIPASP